MFPFRNSSDVIIKEVGFTTDQFKIRKINYMESAQNNLLNTREIYNIDVIL